MTVLVANDVRVAVPVAAVHPVLRDSTTLVPLTSYQLPLARLIPSASMVACNAPAALNVIDVSLSTILDLVASDSFCNNRESVAKSGGVLHADRTAQTNQRAAHVAAISATSEKENEPDS